MYLSLLQVTHCVSITVAADVVSYLSQVVKKVFAPLLHMEMRGGADCPPELVALCMHTLDFMSGLVPHDSTWLSCYSDLLNHHQVQMVLAIALYTGPAHIRHKVLNLIATLGFPADR
ncbi:hypothetical protein PR048_010352 [Dryococelus australis]|uniref:Uncharacterized protein n=1 Tax=Dryococelus australis TaxID=614101 RepID=A0ABQ9I4G6_9NEOP|nr:hypothetical protein PR048_010352 [Dryococelus australis]